MLLLALPWGWLLLSQPLGGCILAHWQVATLPVLAPGCKAKRLGPRTKVSAPPQEMTAQPCLPAPPAAGTASISGMQSSCCCFFLSLIVLFLPGVGFCCSFIVGLRPGRPSNNSCRAPALGRLRSKRKPQTLPSSPASFHLPFLTLLCAKLGSPGLQTKLPCSFPGSLHMQQPALVLPHAFPPAFVVLCFPEGSWTASGVMRRDLSFRGPRVSGQRDVEAPHPVSLISVTLGCCE